MAGASRLAEALAAAGAKMGTVPKNGKNTFYGYSYATESDIVGAVRGALFECGVAIVPAVTGFDRVPITVMTNKGDRATNRCTTHIAFTLIHGESGEQITTPWVGEALDAEDKGLSKCVTNALKYFLRQLFLIETGDLSDEIDNDEPTGKPKASAAPEGNPEAWRDEVEKPKAEPAKPAAPATDPANLASEGQRKFITDLAAKKLPGGAPALDAWLAKNRTASLAAMTKGAAFSVIAVLKAMPDVEQGAAPAQDPAPAGRDAAVSKARIVQAVKDLLFEVEGKEKRKVWESREGVWFVVGTEELELLEFPEPAAVASMSTEQLIALGTFLKGRMAS